MNFNDWCNYDPIGDCGMNRRVHDHWGRESRGIAHRKVVKRISEIERKKRDDLIEKELLKLQAEYRGRK